MDGAGADATGGVVGSAIYEDVAREVLGATAVSKRDAGGVAAVGYLVRAKDGVFGSAVDRGLVGNITRGVVGRNAGGVIGWAIGGYNNGGAMDGATGVSAEGDNNDGPGRATVGLPTMQNEVLSFA